MILSAFTVEPQVSEQIGFAWSSDGEETEGIAALVDRLGNRLGHTALSRLESRDSHIPERASVRVPIENCFWHSHRGRAGPHHVCDERRKIGVIKINFREPPSAAAYPSTSEDLTSDAVSKRIFWASEQWPNSSIKSPRPIRLFAPPEPIKASWLFPDDPPFHFTWRRRAHRVRRADGPERIAEEWWRSEGSATTHPNRDYYRVEDEDGRCFWLFRADQQNSSNSPRWYLHGVFA